MIDLKEYYKMLKCVWKKFNFRVVEVVDWENKSLRVEVENPNFKALIRAEEEHVDYSLI